eukprot:6046221-Amphidinium_carterae.1
MTSNDVEFVLRLYYVTVSLPHFKGWFANLSCVFDCAVLNSEGLHKERVHMPRTTRHFYDGSMSITLNKDSTSGLVLQLLAFVCCYDRRVQLPSHRAFGGLKSEFVTHEHSAPFTVGEWKALHRFQKPPVKRREKKGMVSPNVQSYFIAKSSAEEKACGNPSVQVAGKGELPARFSLAGVEFLPQMTGRWSPSAVQLAVPKQTLHLEFTSLEWVGGILQNRYTAHRSSEPC